MNAANGLQRVIAREKHGGPAGLRWTKSETCPMVPQNFLGMHKSWTSCCKLVVWLVVEFFKVRCLTVLYLCHLSQFGLNSPQILQRMWRFEILLVQG
jgi:hypothetical protein